MGSAMAEPCYVRIIRSAGLLWLRSRSWHTNRDSAGVGFNTAKRSMAGEAARARLSRRMIS